MSLSATEQRMTGEAKTSGRSYEWSGNRVWELNDKGRRIRQVSLPPQRQMGMPSAAHSMDLFERGIDSRAT